MEFKWNPLKATLLIPLPKPDIPETVLSYAQEHGFVEKTEFHASIISFANGKKIMDKFSDDELMIQSIRSLADEFSWNVSYGSEYAVIEKYYDQIELEKSGYENIPEHTRRTIVQDISLPDLALFYEKLNSLTGIAFEVPFSHLTLFSWSDYAPMMTQGIGLYSAADFEKYARELIGL